MYDSGANGGGELAEIRMNGEKGSESERREIERENSRKITTTRA